MNFVALASDANPHYAIYAPIVCRLWRRLGYTPLLTLHDGYGWDTALGSYVLEKLAGFRHIARVPSVAPLSAGNTMRVVRLAAAAFLDVMPEDFILTADMDMAPLGRELFEFAPSLGRIVLLRGDAYGNLASTPPLLANGEPALISGLFRFPLCYVGMEAQIWRELFPLTDNVTESVRRIVHGLRADQIDYDEACCSARVLLSKYAIGALTKHESDPEEFEHREAWTQGDVVLVPLADWAKRDGYPIGMLIHGEGRTPIPDAIDFHMPRPATTWVGGTLQHYWPEEHDFIAEYWPKACDLAGINPFA